MAIGIPETAVIALMVGAFISKDIQSGPNTIGEHLHLCWGSHRNMWIGNVFLAVIYVPLVR